ncbi:MAG TPA: ABC transporter substrate-binding protein [Pseudonocardia sp.]|uniref:ABC transporter substrate-binding protein n=1 Tax=Pseudonocardia sp. TaxID=60912 RepID=UPI002C62BDF0|nr:ABC transporter substrate-binding protein [Pseudonocardia sp.]HTF52105.1 ABC transporter substrate-binding protein [Pseudonocardia sp.]
MRRPLALAVAAILAALLAGCSGSSGSGGPGGSEELVVSGFSFGAQDFQRTVIEPFQQQTGIKVTFEPGSNSDRYNKLLVSKARPDTDVVLMSDLFAKQGELQGLFAKIDPAGVPNLGRTVDFARHSGGMGVPYTFTLLGMLYSTATFGNTAPTVASLWDPKLAGKIALPDISATAGVPFLMAVAQTFGSGPQDMQTAFAKLAELKPHVLQFYSSTTELLSLLQRGEIVAAPGLDLFAYGPIVGGSPIGWAPLDTGKFLSYNEAEIVAGSPHAKAAATFIDFLLSAQAQSRTAAAFFDKPVNREATVPDIVTRVSGGAAKDPGAAGFAPVDLDFVAQHRAEWIDEFARKVSG